MTQPLHAQALPCCLASQAGRGAHGARRHQDLAQAMARVGTCRLGSELVRKGCPASELWPRVALRPAKEVNSSHTL